MSDNRPIGVFDSGVGGLTVLRALHEHLPGESTVYLGDLARCPYGPRPQNQVRDFAIEIGGVLARCDIKALVVACNTATAAAYDELCNQYPFPVIGVIAPGSREAARLTRNGRIGVIATDGTVASGAYRRAISEVMPNATVIQRSASWLVTVIERGALGRPEIATRLAATLAEMRLGGIDTLILGCTHFPIVRDIFEAEIGPGITLLDSADTTSVEVVRVVKAFGMAADGQPTHRVLVTGPAEAFAERAQAMFRSSPEIETVSLSQDAVLS